MKDEALVELQSLRETVGAAMAMIDRLIAATANDAAPVPPTWDEVRHWYAQRDADGEAGTALEDQAAALAAFGPGVTRKWIRELRALYGPAAGRKSGPRNLRRESAPRRG